jgi:hypothetical protein
MNGCGLVKDYIKKSVSAENIYFVYAIQMKAASG